MGRGPRVKRRKPPAEEAQPFDTFEAEDQLPAEEQPKNVNKRYDMADGLEFELPSDVDDDEEIDEDMAFTEEDKIRYAGMFGDEADGGSDGDGGAAQDDDLLASDASEGEDIHPDDLSDEEQPAGGHSDDEGRHAAMLADVRAATGSGSKRKRRDIVVSEAYPESEYNLNPASASAGAEGGELQLSDLIKGLGSSRSKLGAARKTLERLERRSGVVAAPLPGNVQARQERKAAYEVTSKDVTKWQPMVKANREAPTLAFSKPRGGAAKATTTAALTAQHAPETDMEAEVAAMLQAAGVHSAKAVEEAEDALALKALSVEESQARRDRLAKMRALLFYHERKAARMKAIKSKEYRRRTNRAERRKAAKAGNGTGEALREAAEEAEFERAKERLTLKHKNTSKWAKRALRRGINVMDEATKDAMQEQLRLGMQLRQKVEQPQSSDSDSDDSTSASDEGEGDDSRDGSGALAPAGDESGAAGRNAKRKPAYSKSRAAALDLLQDGDGEAGEQKGLFALPFMRRAAEQQKAAATQDAAALLRSIEAEVAGVPEDELQQDGQQGGAQGRFSFGTGAAFEQSGAAPAAAHSSDDDSEAGEHEDAEAKAQRLARAQRQDAATAAHFGSASGGAPDDTPAAILAVQLPASGPDSTAQPSGAAPATSPGPASAGLHKPAVSAQQASNTAQLGASRRHDRLFGSIGGPSASQQQGQRQQQGQQQQQQQRPKDADSQRGGVSIGPASRVVSASLAPGPPAAAAGGAAGAAAALIGRGDAAAAAAAAPAIASGDGRQEGGAAQAEAPAGGSEDEGNDGLPSDAMRPAPGGELSQRELIAMAFAGDDVAADFAAQKAAEAEELPAVDTGPGTLPGWGSWANSKRMQREAEAAALKAKQQKAAALAKRKDAKQAHVVISEKWDRKVQKYAAAAVPFPFDGRDTYERSIRQPLGVDFNTNASFRNLTRPAVIKEAGLLIQPIRYSKAASDKTAGGGRGPRPAKGDGPPKNRPRVKVLAGGMPRN